MASAWSFHESAEQPPEKTIATEIPRQHDHAYNHKLPEPWLSHSRIHPLIISLFHL